MGMYNKKHTRKLLGLVVSVQIITMTRANLVFPLSDISAYEEDEHKIRPYVGIFSTLSLNT